MARKKYKDGLVLKSEVLLIIQNYIRGIQMNDYGTDEGIPQLYGVMKQIENMDVSRCTCWEPAQKEIKVMNGETYCSMCGKLL